MDQFCTGQSKNKTPLAVYVVALGIFTLVTSEFVVAGLMPEMARGLDVSVPTIGYLITAFAAAMAVGGPLLTVAVMRVPPRTALLLLIGVFLAGNLLAATAPNYGVMLAARVITGTAAQAFFGVGITICVRVTRPELRGRAIAAALNGLMLGTLLGLPFATFVGGQLGWRAAFWAISALAVIAGVAVRLWVPALEREVSSARAEADAFRSPRLWLAFSTSTLIIGATFAAFSYLNPILTGLSGFAESSVPLLLVAYGAATLVGNIVVGRLADRHTIGVQIVGLALNLGFLAGFALLAELPVAAVLCMLGIGLVGVTMNPAMVVRVHRASNAGSLVNSIHSSFITLGIIISSSAGAVLLSAHGLRAPLWLGAGLAALGLLTLLPDLTRRPAEAARPVPDPSVGLLDGLRDR
ncbi:MFS transporter [Spirillospora sp. CA-294931]|uniref:MFS transporter n=1 Tax=Spirillospora sp. CA-294931 TaxID=3240042 RepID=UPI003D8FA634